MNLEGEKVEETTMGNHKVWVISMEKMRKTIGRIKGGNSGR